VLTGVPLVFFDSVVSEWRSGFGALGRKASLNSPSRRAPTLEKAAGYADGFAGQVLGIRGG
jgi:hypothetical protein